MAPYPSFSVDNPAVSSAIVVPTCKRRTLTLCGTIRGRRMINGGQTCSKIALNCLHTRVSVVGIDMQLFKAECKLVCISRH